jgi:hypothetical protein
MRDSGCAQQAECPARAHFLEPLSDNAAAHPAAARATGQSTWRLVCCCATARALEEGPVSLRQEAGGARTLCRMRSSSSHSSLVGSSTARAAVTAFSAAVGATSTAAACSRCRSQLRPLVLGCAPQPRSGSALAQQGAAAGARASACSRAAASAAALQERAKRHMPRPGARLQEGACPATASIMVLACARTPYAAQHVIDELALRGRNDWNCSEELVCGLVVDEARQAICTCSRE